MRVAAQASVLALLFASLLASAPARAQAHSQSQQAVTQGVRTTEVAWSAGVSARRAPKAACFLKKLGKKIQDGFKKFGSFLKKGWDKIKGFVCATVGQPICMMVKIVKGFIGFIKLVTKHGFVGALKELWKRFKAKLKREGDYMKEQVGKIFSGFRKVMVMKTFSLKPIEQFARTTVKGVKNLVSRLNKNIGIPKLIGEVIGWITAAPLYPAILAAVTPIAAINYGFRKLMAFIIPKLILGTGKAFNAASHSKAGKVFGTIVKVLLKIAGTGGGAVLKVLDMKNPAAAAKMKAVFERIANVAGKVSKGIEGAMKVAEQVRTGTFEGIEGALKSTKVLPTKLGKEDLKRILDGLMDFGREQVWLALEPVLRKVLMKAVGALGRLLDIPRNALVGAVGTIPFAGGVLAAALNFGLGILLDMVSNFLVDGALKIAETLLTDTWNDIKGNVVRQLTASGKSRKATGGFVAFIQHVGKLAGGVSEAMKTASQGLQGTLASLVSTALDKFILRGIRNPDLRKVLADAVGAVVKSLTGPGGFNLTNAVVEVIKKVKEPLSSLVASPIKNANLRNLVKGGLSTLLGSLANAGGVSKVMKNPLGFLTEVGMQLLDKLKTPLANMILGKIQNPQIRNVVAAGIGALAAQVKSGGFSALLKFRELLGRLYRSMKQPVLDLLMGQIKNDRLRAALESGITFVASELESKGIAGILQGGIGGFFVRLFEVVKDPLVDLLLAKVSSPLLRDGARKAIDAIIAKAKAGKLSELLNFKKVLADVIRFLKPTIIGFLGGRIADAGLKAALSGSVGAAIDRVAGMFERGSFQGLFDTLVAAAEPALVALKGYVTGKVPGMLKAPIGQAFDKVIPMLRTADGRMRLLREGPKMLWTGVVDYLRGLYQKAKDFAAAKFAEVKAAVFNVIEGIRGAAGNIGDILSKLTNLGGLLGGAKVPGISAAAAPAAGPAAAPSPVARPVARPVVRPRPRPIVAAKPPVRRPVTPLSGGVRPATGPTVSRPAARPTPTHPTPARPTAASTPAAKPAVATRTSPAAGAKPAAAVNLNVVRQAFTNAYRSYTRAYRTGILAARSLQGAISRAVKGANRTTALRALSLFRRSFMGALRMARVAMRYVRSGLSARTSAALLGRAHQAVSGPGRPAAVTATAAGPIAGPFQQATAALVQIARFGGQYLLGGAALVPSLNRYVANFNRQLAAAQQALGQLAAKAR